MIFPSRYILNSEKTSLHIVLCFME
uniref:Uncharacterized protein n=1 Tax=Heterorhabditis bacteriophora TaxID=37862 RepID=A0A1I7XJD6_HETBA